MASLTFVMNDSSTGGNNPKVEVTITENPDGSLTFSLRQLQSAGAYIGDLRGFFFDLPDSQESALAGASVTNQIKNPDGSGTGTAAQNAAAVMGNDSVMSAGGNSNNMNGLSSGGNGYDFGLEIGSEGIGRGGDDVRSFSFTLAPAANKTLSLSDFANATFGVRVMSVGQDIDGNGSIDTARNGSSKIAETTFTYVTAVNDDTGCVDENSSATGNIFTNDTGKTALDVMTVTSWDTDGNAGNGVLTIGTAYEIVDDSGPNAGDDAAGATVTLNANGVWVVDASSADALSEGEHIEQTFTVNVKQDHYVDGAHLNLDGTYTTTETFTVEVCGVNDGPVANDDDFTGEDGDNCIPEAGTFADNVLTNDTDVDRLDTISVTGIYDGDGNLILLDQGEADTDGADTAIVTLASGAQVTINSDGTFSYDTNHAFDGMVDGDMREDSFVYQLSDNNGATDEATATVCIDGEGDNGGGGGGGGGGGDPPVDDFPTFAKLLSNAVFYVDRDGSSDTTDDVLKVKVDLSGSGLYDLDNADVQGQELSDWVLSHYAGSSLLAVSIHAGNNDIVTSVYVNDTSPPNFNQSGYDELQLIRANEGRLFLYGDSDPQVEDYTPPAQSTEIQNDPTNPTNAVYHGGQDYSVTAEMLLLGLTHDVLMAGYDAAYNYNAGNPI